MSFDVVVRSETRISAVPYAHEPEPKGTLLVRDRLLDSKCGLSELRMQSEGVRPSFTGAGHPPAVNLYFRGHVRKRSCARSRQERGRS